jgi:hypothetical protein
LYDQQSLDACWDLVKDWTAEERQALRDGVGKQGFKTPFRKATVHELSHRMLDIATAGLKRRAALDGAGMSEDGFLNPLRELVNRGYTRAEEIVKRMRGLNELTDRAIASFAETNRFNEVAAALALLNNVPTDMMAKVIDGPRNDLVLIPCKSAGLNWLAVESILHNRPVKPQIDEETLKVAWKDYGKLSPETARRTLHFWQLHDKIVK